jgi:hypothetical protein
MSAPTPAQFATTPTCALGSQLQTLSVVPPVTPTAPQSRNDASLDSLQPEGSAAEATTSADANAHDPTDGVEHGAATDYENGIFMSGSQRTCQQRDESQASPLGNEDAKNSVSYAQRFSYGGW